MALDIEDRDIKDRDITAGPAVAQVHIPRWRAAGRLGLPLAAMASLGAGTIHAAAIGLHAEHPQLARIFIVTALVELLGGLAVLLRPNRWTALGMVLVNLAAAIGWFVTRVAGISWIDGLEVRESPQLADTSAAILATVAMLGALGACRSRNNIAPAARLLIPAILVAALTIPAMVNVSSHDHTGHGDTAAATWPRPWNPSQPIDVSGVAGVTPEQQTRAENLIRESLASLPRYADTATAIADGYTSIGDSATGNEHYIKTSLIQDDVMLDATQPESLVYSVNGDTRTLTGAMYIASQRPTDDPTLLNFAGSLMQWHNHGDLCFSIDTKGNPIVVGLLQANGTCAAGINAGGSIPMVHVWITPHPCGVFAALEGTGAGQTAVPESQRVDKCPTTHDHS
jgi:hypothetical protein